MYPELHLVTYRQHERELAQRLERRRVAQERAGASSGAAGGPPTTSRRHGLRSAVASGRVLGPRLAGRLARTRHAVREASAPTVCCSPA